MGRAPDRTKTADDDDDDDDVGDSDSPVMPGEGARWLAHPSRHGTPTAAATATATATANSSLHSHSNTNVGSVQLSDLPVELGADEDARRPPVDEQESPVGLGIGIAGPQAPSRAFAPSSPDRTGAIEASSGRVSYAPIILPPPPPAHSTGDTPTARPRSLTLEQRLSGFDTRPPLLALGLNPARPDAGAATVQASWIRQQPPLGAQGARGLRTRGDTDLDALKPNPSPTSSPTSRTAFPTTSDDPFSFRSSTQGVSPSRNTADPPSSQPRAVTPTNRPTGSLTAPSSATRSVSSTTSSTRSGPPTLASIAHTSPASTRSSSNSNSSHPLSKPSPHALLAAALFADAPKQPKTSKAEKRGSLFGFPIGAKKKPVKKDQFDESTESSRSSGSAPVLEPAPRVESPASMFRRMGEEEDAADAAKLALEGQSSSPSSIFRRLGEGSPTAPVAARAAPGGLFRRFDDDEPAPAKGGPPSPASAFRRLMDESSPTQASAPAGVFRRVTDDGEPAAADPSPDSTLAPSPASIFRRMGWDASPPLTTTPAQAAVPKPTPSPIIPAPVTATPAPVKRTNSSHSVPTPAASAHGFQYGGDDTPPMPSPTASGFRSMGDDGPAAAIAASPAASNLRRMGDSPAPAALVPHHSPANAFPSPSVAFRRIADEIAAATPAAARTPSPAVTSFRRMDDSRDSPQSTPPITGLRKFVEPVMSPVLAPAVEVPPAPVESSPASAFQKLMEESSPNPASSPAGMFRKFNDTADVETEPPAREPSPASAFRRMMEEGSRDPSAGSPAPATSAFRKMGDDASPALTAGSPSSVFRRFGQETSSPVVLASSPASAFRRMEDSESPVPDAYTPRSAFSRLGNDGQSHRSSPASASAFRRVNDDSPALSPSPVLGHASAASSFRRVESPGASPASSPASVFGRLGQESPASQSSASVFERMAELEQEEDDEIDHDDPFWSAMQAPAREVRNVGMLARVQQEPFVVTPAQNVLVEASRHRSPAYEVSGRPASKSVSSVGSGGSQSRSMASGFSQPKPAATAKSIKSVKSVKEEYVGLPPFPAPRSDLFLKQLTGEDLHKYESVSSTFKRSKPAWQTRYLILTSYPTPEHSTAPLLANLHSFKSSFATEKEMTRLELTKWSIVCVPEDNFGRLYALKVTGIVPAERDAKGRIPHTHQSKEDSWLIGMDSVDSLKLWMEQLKGIVEELNAAPAAPTTTPPTEMRRTPSDGASIHSHSSGVRTPDLYQTRTPASPQHPSPSRPTKSPRRPPLPEGSSRLSQYSSTDFSHEYEDESTTPSTTFSSKFDEQHQDDDDEDPETFHPYRRSAHHSVADTPPRLAVPASGINGFARRGSVDDSSAPRNGGGYRQPQDLIRRDSDLSSLGSMSSSHHLPRSQPPSGALPTTPPLGHAYEHSSPHSRSPSMRTVGSNSERTSNYSKRMSVASSGSAGSGGAAQPRMWQPPMPAPMGALPPPPMPAPMGALPPPPTNAPTGTLPPPPHFHPFAAPPPMRPHPMGALPPPPMGLPLPPPPAGSLPAIPLVQHQPMGLRTYAERD